MAFDFGKLLADPTFQFGASLLFNGRQPNAVPQAFGALQQAAALKQERALREQQFDIQQQQMQMQQQQAEAEARYREATLRNSDRVDERERLKLQIDAANLARQERQLELEMEQEQRRRATQDRFMEQLESAGLFGPSLPRGETLEEGGETPAAPRAPQRNAPRTPNAPSGQRGRFGTPVALLDNLEQVESSGNPRALGPRIRTKDGRVVRAEGAYQFHPDTTADLRRQGMQFDPFNRDQARDAADFYLAQLARQHGGDYAKALAAYGGFATKDPSSYVSRVLQGVSPPPAAATGAQATPTPNRGLALARMGAAGAMAGIPGAKELVELGKMMEPNTVAAGSYREDPVTGRTTFVGDPYKERDQDLRERQFNVDTAKTSLEVAKAAEEVKVKQQENADRKLKTENAIEVSSRFLETVRGAMNPPPGATGLTGAIARRIPGTRQYDYDAQIEALKSQQGIEALKELAATGVSLGQVSNYEGQQLQRQIANLDPSQSRTALVKELKKIESAIISLQQRTIRGYELKYGAKPPNASAAPVQPNAPAVRRPGASGIKFLGYE